MDNLHHHFNLQIKDRVGFHLLDHSLSDRVDFLQLGLIRSDQIE